MRRLTTAKRVQVIQALIEGCSIRSTVRMTGVHKTTILKLITALGTAFRNYHDEHVRGLTCDRIQCDEIWNFCYVKQKSVSEEKQGRFGFGDVWTWTAIDPDSKLMVSWLVGMRDAGYAIRFMNDVADRLINRAQLTTDGLKSYLVAVENAFGRHIDYARLVKIYGPDRTTATRYSPPMLSAIDLDIRTGNSDPNHISTSFAERSNLTLRMGMRRATRLTNAHSKKGENHEAMTSIFWTYYNFCRKHMSIGTTPAVKAGIADHIWGIEEPIGLLDTSTEV